MLPWYGSMIARIFACFLLLGAAGFAAQASQYISPTGVSSQGFVMESAPGVPLAGLPATVCTGQAKIATTGIAVRLPSCALTNGFPITASSKNAACITMGGSSVTNVCDGTGNGLVRQPGESWSWAVPNTNAIWINGTAGDWVTWGGN